MFVQQWEPVVFKRERPKSAPPTRPKETDLETKRIKVYARELSDAVMKARLEKKMTQDQLAKACNVQRVAITEIETRKGIYDANLVNKVCKILGIKVDIRFSEA